MGTENGHLINNMRIEKDGNIAEWILDPIMCLLVSQAKFV
jgi:hypothetical protein